MTLIFDPSYPRSNLTVPVESPLVLHIRAAGSPTTYLSPFSRYFESQFWRWPFDLGRTNPCAKVHQKGRWPAATQLVLPSYQISSPCINLRRRYSLRISCRQTNRQTEKQ